MRVAWRSTRSVVERDRRPCVARRSNRSGSYFVSMICSLLQCLFDISEYLFTGQNTENMYQPLLYSRYS